MLMTEHNLWFYQGVMSDLRAAISESRLAAFAADFRDRYAAGRAR
jgi:queuine tRNA-ribosyltransferase